MPPKRTRASSTAEVPSTSRTATSPAPSTQSEASDSTQDSLPLLDTDTTLHDPSTQSQSQSKTTAAKRKSKKDVPHYEWSDEQTRALAECIEMNECLYNKRSKEWVNLTAKAQIWEQIGQQMEPVATGEQCKKWYDNQRTRLGKIMRKKSGQGRQVMSGREDEIVATWTFLKQHLQRASSTTSETFPITTQPEAESAATVAVEDDDCSSIGDDFPPTPTASVVSRPGKRSKTASPTPSQTTSKADEFRDAFMSVRHELMPRPTTLTGHRKLVHNFATFMETHMEMVDMSRWHHYQIDILNLTERYKSPDFVPQHPAPQQHAYQPPPPPQWTQQQWMPTPAPQSSIRAPWPTPTWQPAPAPLPSPVPFLPQPQPQMPQMPYTQQPMQVVTCSSPIVTSPPPAITTGLSLTPGSADHSVSSPPQYRLGDLDTPLMTPQALVKDD